MMARSGRPHSPTIGADRQRRSREMFVAGLPRRCHDQRRTWTKIVPPFQGGEIFGGTRSQAFSLGYNIEGFQP
jgi:hypothetical protein